MLQMDVLVQRLDALSKKRIVGIYYISTSITGFYTREVSKEADFPCMESASP